MVVVIVSENIWKEEISHFLGWPNTLVLETFRLNSFLLLLLNKEPPLVNSGSFCLVWIFLTGTTKNITEQNYILDGTLSFGFLGNRRISLTKSLLSAVRQSLQRKKTLFYPYTVSQIYFLVFMFSAHSVENL